MSTEPDAPAVLNAACGDVSPARMDATTMSRAAFVFSAAGKSGISSARGADVVTGGVGAKGIGSSAEQATTDSSPATGITTTTRTATSDVLALLFTVDCCGGCSSPHTS